jgi:hypothetical protein
MSSFGKIQVIKPLPIIGINHHCGAICRCTLGDNEVCTGKTFIYYKQKKEQANNKVLHSSLFYNLRRLTKIE